jgi:hypothetical protein
MNIFYPNQHVFNPFPATYQTSITIEDADTLGAASKFGNACCLNFASHKRPGGGYRGVRHIKGPIRTQEEDLFRRSNLPELMDTTAVKGVYPLLGLCGFYTSEIIVDKGPSLESIDAFQISMVTVPALVRPGTAEHLDLTRRKLCRILNIAAEHGHHDLILGAWGCGVFHNDPAFISKGFMSLLRGEFSGVFSNVVFAIPDSKCRNYTIFEQALGK